MRPDLAGRSNNRDEVMKMLFYLWWVGLFSATSGGTFTLQHINIPYLICSKSLRAGLLWCFWGAFICHLLLTGGLRQPHWLCSVAPGRQRAPCGRLTQVLTDHLTWTWEGRVISCSGPTHQSLNRTAVRDKRVYLRNLSVYIHTMKIFQDLSSNLLRRCILDFCVDINPLLFMRHLSTEKHFCWVGFL